MNDENAIAAQAERDQMHAAALESLRSAESYLVIAVQKASENGIREIHVTEVVEKEVGESVARICAQISAQMLLSLMSEGMFSIKVPDEEDEQ